MNKLKLNIQRFASTNTTTYYNLSQYIATDKPTYLIDYNGDMAKIDTAIHNAMSKATNNETNIGTLSNLNTTEKGSLVGAINEVNTQVGTNTSNISQNSSDILANSTKIGTLADLITTYKVNVVGAINEVKTEANSNKANIEKFNLSNFKTYNSTNINSSNGTIGGGSITVATNSDGSIGKIYSDIDVTPVTAGLVILTFASDLRPTSNINIGCCGFCRSRNTSQFNNCYMTIDTSGLVTLQVNTTDTGVNNVVYFPCLYFMKDFGDVIPA